jgi:hypothetical protein
MKILVAGWFSFEEGHATAGDLLARDVACEWLHQRGFDFEIATAAPFQGGVDVRTVDPEQYSHLLVVCGPWEQGELEAILLERFWKCRLIGLDLSMQAPLEIWNPFDFLIERDSSLRAHPDLVFASQQPLVPVVGVCLVEDYPRGATAVTNAAIQRLVDSQPMAVINIDTRLDTNSTGFRNPAEVESVIGRLDVMVTTRLHGAVLALKNGVPAIAIDPEPGGAKICRQAGVIGWPVVFHAGRLDDHALQNAFRFCLTREAREQARSCSQRARTGVLGIGDSLLSALKDPATIDSRYHQRVSAMPSFVNPDQSAGMADEGSSAPPYLLSRIRKRLAPKVPQGLRPILSRWLKSGAAIRDE